MIDWLLDMQPFVQEVSKPSNAPGKLALPHSFPPLGCNMGHTVPTTGMGYVGTGETHGFQSYTMVYQYSGIPSVLLWYTAGACINIYVYIVHKKYM